MQYRLATANATQSYRLATKTKTGDVIQFGPKMAMRQAQEKQSALAKLSTYPVYVVNTQAL
jgi:hypothetical protein